MPNQRVYTYDAYGRLTKSVTTDYNNSNAVSTVTYGYDAVGNRTSMTEGGKTTTYTYSGLNQLTAKTLQQMFLAVTRIPLVPTEALTIMSTTRTFREVPKALQTAASAQKRHTNILTLAK